MVFGGCNYTLGSKTPKKVTGFHLSLGILYGSDKLDFSPEKVKQ
jgi:hypothetical protein